MYNYLRVRAVVPPVTVADVRANGESLRARLREIGTDGGIAVFPELCLTGYTCGDLFFQQQLHEAVRAQVEMLLADSRDLTGIYLIGAPLRICGQLYNCALVLGRGRLWGIVPKTFLPNYNEFYEKRWFASAEDLPCAEIFPAQLGLPGEEPIPVGSDLVFTTPDGLRFGVELCEDLWAPLPPSTLLAMHGAEVVFNLSASNETIAKHDYRRALVRQQSARLLCGYVYCSAGCGESTTDLIFSGNSLIAENGALLAENCGEIATDYVLAADLDLGKIRADRLKNTCFRDCARVYGAARAYRSVSIPIPLSSDGTLVRPAKHPFVPEGAEMRTQRCLSIFRMQAQGLKKRVQATNCKMVVGVSGGLDSTLALLVAAETAKLAGIGSENVVGITMPGFGTTGKTYRNSLALMRALGVTVKEIPIADACLQHFRVLGHDPSNHNVVYENAQARERTQILMDYSNRIGGIVVGTGDLSELALGWCTYNGDHMSMYAVNASVPKTLVRWMVESIARAELFSGCRAVLLDILDTPISPELLPPDARGNIIQQTEDLVGPYELHDFFLYYMLRYGFRPRKIAWLACRAFAPEYSPREITRWMHEFYRRFFQQQFKRSCLPDGVKIGSVCLSPRGDWRMPSDAAAAEWLREVEAMTGAQQGCE